MLHPVNPLPAEIQDKLFSLIERQRELLVFAVNHSSFDEANFRKELGEDFTEWLLLNQYTGIHVNLEQLTRCPQVDKDLALSDFEHDQAFCKGDDPTFQFAFDPEKTDAHQAAKKCLNPFFDRFYGFDLLLPGKKSFRKRDIYEGYKMTNPAVGRVCAFCDGSMKRDGLTTQSKDYTVEHFFQKDKHPSICLHPYNLIPCCEVCNEQRGDLEALELNGRLLALGEIFHPILRPARERVELRYYSHSLEPEELEFVKIYPEDWQVGIELYARLYRIPARWKEIWPDIDSVIEGRLRGAIDSHWFPSQTKITLIDFELMLHLAVWSLQNYATKYEYPARHWLMWARNDPQRVKQLYESLVVSQGFGDS